MLETLVPFFRLTFCIVSRIIVVSPIASAIEHRVHTDKHIILSWWLGTLS